jgi:hypothetical protein
MSHFAHFRLLVWRRGFRFPTPLHFRPRCRLRIGPWGMRTLGVGEGVSLSLHFWYEFCFWSLRLGRLLGYQLIRVLGSRLWRAGPAAEQLVETKQAPGMREQGKISVWSFDCF